MGIGRDGSGLKKKGLRENYNMIIKEVREEFDYCSQSLKIYVNGALRASFTDGEIEDNNLYRNFSDCFSITTLMKAAYEAGKNGEDFELTQEFIEED